jgi:DNA-binding CsgD family transcriptional regulator
MKRFDYALAVSQHLQKITGDVSKDEAKSILEDLLKSQMLSKLFAFGDHALMIVNWKSKRFEYVSPSIENIVGQHPDDFFEFSDLNKIFDDQELKLMAQRTSLFATAAIKIIPKLTLDELKHIRFIRNNWGKRKDGTPIHILFQSLGHFNEQKKLQMEILIISDITIFNNSHLHFAKISKLSDYGSEEILWDLALEEDDITPREKEIFRLLIHGKTSHEVATQLNISIETVKTHRKNLLNKTKSDNSIELLRYGLAHGWI